MNKRRLLGSLLLLFPCALFAYGSVIQYRKKGMIEAAEAIAVVTVTKVEKVSHQIDGFVYRQKAEGAVERVLKGELPDEINLLADCSWICALPTTFKKGSFLLFLSKRGDFWTSANWQLGIRPIKEKKKKNKEKEKQTTVEWFADGRTRSKMREFLLDDVTQEITKILKDLKKKTPNKGMKTDQ